MYNQLNVQLSNEIKTIENILDYVYQYIHQQKNNDDHVLEYISDIQGDIQKGYP